jgi:hypothetical protein
VRTGAEGEQVGDGAVSGADGQEKSFIFLFSIIEPINASKLAELTNCPTDFHAGVLFFQATHRPECIAQVVAANQVESF